MNHTYFLLALIVAIFAYCALVDRRRRPSPAEPAEDSAPSDTLNETTRETLGERACIYMTENVAAIMRRHSRDKCVAIPLTSGATAGAAADILHHLLPGDPLELRPGSDEDICSVDVFSGQHCVGSLYLGDAEEAMAVITGFDLKGAYVCEQNSYDYYDRVSLRIILFYGDKETGECPETIDDTLINADTPYKVTLGGNPVTVTLFQN